MENNQLTILSPKGSTLIKQSDVFTRPNIYQLKKAHSTAVLVSAICKIVEDKIRNFNFTMPMTAEQRVVFAEEFIDLYYTDTLEDLVMMFRYAIAGRIGSRYNTCDPRTLFEWYKEYLDIKLQEKERIIKQTSKVEDAPPREIPPQLQELIKKYTARPPKVDHRKPTHSDFMSTVEYMPLKKLESLLEALQNPEVFNPEEVAEDIAKVKKLIKEKSGETN